jgi:hypothetical protein
MGKFLSILIGLILLALGIWGVIAWSGDVLIFLKAAIALMAIVVGLGIFVFGVSELRAGGEEPPIVEPTPPAGESSEQSSSGESQSS